MVQYCRYCSYMVCGDANYCSHFKRTFSTENIKKPNKCKGFDFNEIDALGENPKPYTPREKNPIHSECCGQIEFEKGDANDEQNHD